MLIIYIIIFLCKGITADQELANCNVTLMANCDMFYAMCTGESTNYAYICDCLRDYEACLKEINCFDKSSFINRCEIYHCKNCENKPTSSNSNHCEGFCVFLICFSSMYIILCIGILVKYMLNKHKNKHNYYNNEYYNY